ncbi:type II toxin-antitoxin system RelE/ParE family toxin [Rhodoferax sp.]|uniref:type II toxin-antitoxin system RelE/ParE family toxin n=1 Tax=Rhodoferax sp. TaxID=50421 RepID=UPI001A0136E5|nr:type II toxin-antitoxin system RelE/ParE family toxin [Rhodoferax sp.]MBE0473274.1 type II toxin-antitoxin system RelE/ParE family toxin [Rhodoferax sp.]
MIRAPACRTTKPWHGLSVCWLKKGKRVLSVNWKLDAQDDLVKIIDYIEQRNELAARELHETIMRAAENLPLMPYVFRPGREPGTREYVVHPNYILVYRVGNEIIDVLRVLHSRQKYP